MIEERGCYTVIEIDPEHIENSIHCGNYSNFNGAMSRVANNSYGISADEGVKVSPPMYFEDYEVSIVLTEYENGSKTIYFILPSSTRIDQFSDIGRV